MKIQPFQGLYPNLEVLASPDTFFATVKYEFADYLKNDFFHQTDGPALFLTDIHTPVGIHTGLVASVDIEEYIDGNILRHEDTITGTEVHLTDLLMQRRAMIKPVLMTYRPHPRITALLEEARQVKPLFSVFFEQEQHRHVYYQISDPGLIDRFCLAFAEHMEKAYIADGHHRCSSNASLYKSLEKGGNVADIYRYLLCSFFAFDQVEINEYNRIIELPREMSPSMLIAQLSSLCKIKYLTEPVKPESQHEMVLYINREWYRLRWKKKVLKKYQGKLVQLDTDILNNEVFKAIFGIEDVRSDSRISYLGGVAGLEAFAEKTDKMPPFKAGFVLHPIAFDDFVTVADAGKSLPPKSTWFEPRVKNGLISQHI